MTALLDALAAAGLAALGTVAAAPLLVLAAGAAARLAPGPRAKEAVWTIALALCAAPMLAAPFLPPVTLPDLAPAAEIEPAPLPMFVDGPMHGVAPAAAAPTPAAKTAETEARPTTGAPLRALGLIGAAAVAGGLAAGGVLALRRRRRLAAALAATAPLDDPALAADVDRRRRALAIARAPALRRTPHATAPFAVGGRSPLIVLPDALLAVASPAEAASVCGHELAHLKRRDHLRRAVERTLASALWFAPGVAVITARLDDAREAVCDAVALAAGAVSRRAYARTLLAAHRCAADAAPAGAFAFIALRRRRNAMRFDLLLADRPRGSRLRAAAAAGLMLAFGGGLAAANGALAATVADRADAAADVLAEITLARRAAGADAATYEVDRLDGGAPYRFQVGRGESFEIDFRVAGELPLRIRLVDGGGAATFADRLTVSRGAGPEGTEYAAVLNGTGKGSVTVVRGRGRMTTDIGGDGTLLEVTLAPGDDMSRLDALPEPPTAARAATVPPVATVAAASDLPRPAAAPAADTLPAAPTLAAAPRFSAAVVDALGARLTSPYGERVIDGETRFHAGVDVAAPIGTDVRAAAAGRVVEIRHAGDDGNAYGHMVVVDHGDGWKARYSNLSRIDVGPDDRISAGDVIGGIGDSSKTSKGPHLHLELWEGSSAVDPLPRLQVLAED